MRALHFDGAQLRLLDLPLPSPADEALVRVQLAGVCRTDLEIIRGYKGFQGVLGHEFVGSVIECAQSDWVGRRVVGEINCGCGECPWCRQHGDARHCPSRTVIGILGRDGAFAEYLRLPLANLHPVPSQVSDWQAVFAEPLAAALAVRDHLHPAEPVLVVGDGRLGALLGLALQASGYQVCLCGRHPDKLRQLTDLGLSCCDWEQASRRSWRQAVEASGSIQVPGRLLELLEPRGRLVLKTTGVEAAQLDLSTLVVKEIQLLGSRCGPMAPALELMARQDLPLEGLITREVPLSCGLEAFESQASGFKTLLDPTR